MPKPSAPSRKASPCSKHPMNGIVSVSWLNADHDLVFRLVSDSDMTQEEAVTLAETVARVKN